MSEPRAPAPQLRNDSTATDEQLIANYRETNSRDDLERLIARHIGNVRNLAYRLVLCHTTADDITQEVFLKMISGIQTFRGQSQLSTWLYRITVNSAKSSRRRWTARNITNIPLEAISSEIAGPDQRAMQTEITRATSEALSRLPLKLRTAIVLTTIEDLSPQQAARIDGCSLATMYWRVHKARKLLKRYLQKQFEP